MEKVSEVYVILDNAPGAAGQMCRALKKKRIKIYAIAMFIDFARMHVSDAGLAVEVLQEYGYQAELREALRIRLRNDEGVLMELTQKLGNAGINIEYLYGAMQEKQRKGVVIMEVDDVDLAMRLFENDDLS